MIYGVSIEQHRKKLASFYCA